MCTAGFGKLVKFTRRGRTAAAVRPFCVRIHRPICPYICRRKVSLCRGKHRPAHLRELGVFSQHPLLPQKPRHIRSRIRSRAPARALQEAGDTVAYAGRAFARRADVEHIARGCVRALRTSCKMPRNDVLYK